MGVIGKILGSSGAIGAIGTTVKDVSEVFAANATRRMELSAEAQAAALAQHGAEFSSAGDNAFDRVVNGINRLPRPMLAFGTIGLFTYAMIDPPGFGSRMVGLNQVPEPLWWLLGAIVSFYFGAREAHYFRTRPVSAAAPSSPVAPDEPNSALEDWLRTSAG